jgi:hypothetical protein
MVRASRRGSGCLPCCWTGLIGLDWACQGPHHIGCDWRNPLGPQRDEHGPLRVGLHRATPWRNLCSPASCVDARHNRRHTSKSGRDRTNRLWHSRDRGRRHTPNLRVRRALPRSGWPRVLGHVCPLHVGDPDCYAAAGAGVNTASLERGYSCLRWNPAAPPCAK